MNKKEEKIIILETDKQIIVNNNGIGTVIFQITDAEDIEINVEMDNK